MKITAKHRCGCRDPQTKQKFPAGSCPDRAKRGHGFWSGEARVPKELVALAGTDKIRFRGETRKEAEADGEKKWAALRAGQQHIGDLTTGAYLDQWFAGKRALRPGTRRRYGDFVNHLKPWLGDIPLGGLRSHHVDQALRRIEETTATRPRPVGPATLKDIHDMLKTALNDAVRQRMIPFNPAVGVELPEYAPPEVEPWEAEEVGVFLAEAASDRLSAMWELIALHGLRRGEACGAMWGGLDDVRSVLTISQQITGTAAEMGVWAPKTRSGKRKVDLDATTLGRLLLDHRPVQDDERRTVGAAWNNGILPDDQGRPVQLRDLMFTRPDGRHLDPQWVTRRMQQIARNAGLCTTVRVAAAAGAEQVIVGLRRAAPVGEWTLYVNREPVAQVRVVEVEQMRGTRARLHLAEPLPVDVEVGAELGRDLLSPRRLHDLRHSSASIQLAAGVDLALVSKRLGHSSSSITANLYVHLLRSAGQQAAETISAAIPRATRRPHHVRTGDGDGSGILGTDGVGAGQRPVRSGRARPHRAEARGFEPRRGYMPPTALAVRRHRPD